MMPDLSALAELYMNKPRSTDLNEFADQFNDVVRLLEMAKGVDEPVYNQCVLWLAESFVFTTKHFKVEEFTAAVIRRGRDEEAFT